jgi:hypothetical protein
MRHEARQQRQEAKQRRKNERKARRKARKERKKQRREERRARKRARERDNNIADNNNGYDGGYADNNGPADWADEQEEDDENKDEWEGAAVEVGWKVDDDADWLNNAENIWNEIEQRIQDTSKRFVLKLEYKNGTTEYFTLGQKVFPNLRYRFVRDISSRSTSVSYGSNPDYEFLYELAPVTAALLSLPVGNRDNRSFAYLRYVLANEAKDLDLARYQLFTEVGQEKDSTHCLLHSLRMAGVSEAQLVDIDWKFVGNLAYVSRKALESVAESLNCQFKVIPLNINHHNSQGFTRSRTVFYNKKAPSDRVIELGLVHEHLFINERTNYSGYFIRNIDYCRRAAKHLGWTDGREERVCSDPLKRGYKFARPEQCIWSVALMKYIFFQSDRPLVKPETSGAFSKKSDLVSRTCFLTRDVVEQSQKPFQVSTKSTDDLPMFACDIEAVVGGKKHVAILAAAIRLPNSKTLPPAQALNEQKHLDQYLEQQFGEGSEVLVRYGIKCLDLLFTAIADQIHHERGREPPEEQATDVEDEGGEGETRSMCPRVLLYFHNLRYDSKHLYSAFRTTRLVQKGQTLYSVSFRHHGVLFQCIDSLKVIDMALTNFQSKLNLPKCFRKRGDLISYSFFRVQHVAGGYLSQRTSVHDYLQSNKSLHTVEEKQEFHKLLLDELSSPEQDYRFDEESMTFNSNLLYAEYLRWDCRVLAAGLIAVHYSMNSIHGLTKPVSVLGKMTLPSIAKTMFWQENCFNSDETQKPCIAMVGILRNWMHRAIVGGRVMPSLRCPFGFVSGRFQYLDVCSLYPSSVVRICNDLGGFPSSRCQLLDKDAGQLEPAFLFDSNKVMTFVVRVRITAIHREQACGIPALSYQSADGNSRLYINRMPDDGSVVETYLGKIALEDAIQIHQIEYEVLEGVYWSVEGGLVASSYGPTVQALYNRRAHVEHNEDGSIRLQVKKTAEGEAIKRLLNSGAYGIFIQKPNDTRIKFMAQAQIASYVYNQYQLIYRFYPLGKTWAVEEYENDTGAMPCHWGLMVLEMSKRIMNEVLSCLSDIGGKAYYTDTDSVTIDDADVKPLADEFRRRYGRELYGDELAQMHSDFSLYDDKKKAIPEDNVVSTGFACAGKKSYLHLLEGQDKDGKTHYGYKVSSKGITNAGLLSMALALCPDEERDQPLHLQHRAGLRVLYSEISKVGSPGYSINLFPPESNRQKFVYTKDSVSTSAQEFRRVLKNTRKVNHV